MVARKTPRNAEPSEENINQIEEEIIENEIQEEEEEEDEAIQKPPPKKKRVLTDAQKANFNKLQAANKVRYEARKAANEANGIVKKPKVAGSNVNTDILTNKEEYIKKEIAKKTTEIQKEKTKVKEVSDEDEEPVYVKKKKKKKPRIIVEEDSSDSEQEIVISRRRKNKKPIAPPSVPIDIPTNHNDMDTKIEKEKPIVKKEPVLKEYTHLQILRGLGL